VSCGPALSAFSFLMRAHIDLKSVERVQNRLIECESALVSRFQGGDEAAFEEIIDTYSEYLHRFIYRYVKDAGDAEDILYHTFVKAWRGRESYRAEARFRTWLYIIAKNLCLDNTRKQERHPADFAAKWNESNEETIFDAAENLYQINPAEYVVRDEDVLIVRHAIDKLPPNLKSALILFSLEDISQKETAQILECSGKTVETRVYRAKKLLRKKLERLWEDYK